MKDAITMTNATPSKDEALRSWSARRKEWGSMGGRKLAAAAEGRQPVRLAGQESSERASIKRSSESELNLPLRRTSRGI